MHTKHSYFVSSLKNLKGTSEFLLFLHKISEDYGSRRVISYTSECKMLAFKIQGKLDI